jgi:hypothetical protein
VKTCHLSAAEFGALGPLRHQYVAGVQFVDGCLTAAARIHAASDLDRAATIEACRLAAIKALNDLAELIASERERRES